MLFTLSILLGCATTGIFAGNITSARIDEVIPLTSQGEFFVLTTKTRINIFGPYYNGNSQHDILRCFNEVTKTQQETICFSVFDTTDALDMALQKEDSGAEISVVRKR